MRKNDRRKAVASSLRKRCRLSYFAAGHLVKPLNAWCWGYEICLVPTPARYQGVPGIRGALDLKSVVLKPNPVLQHWRAVTHQWWTPGPVSSSNYHAQHILCHASRVQCREYGRGLQKLSQVFVVKPGVEFPAGNHPRSGDRTNPGQVRRESLSNRQAIRLELLDTA